MNNPDKPAKENIKPEPATQAALQFRRKHWYWPFRLLCIIDICMNLFFFHVIYFSIGVSVGLARVPLNYAYADSINTVFMWMILHLFFTLMFILAAKASSITQCFAAIYMLLNFLFIVAFFFGYSIRTEIKMFGSKYNVPETVYYSIAYDIVDYWFCYAILVPIFLIFDSFAKPN